MTEQSAKKPLANPENVASEPLKDEQLAKVSGGNAPDNHLAKIETRTIADPDSGTEPGEETSENPVNIG